MTLPSGDAIAHTLSLIACEQADTDDLLWCAKLTRAYGAVSRAVLEQRAEHAKHVALLDVAAVACSWAAALTGSFGGVLERVRAERDAHEARKADGRWAFTCADAQMPEMEKHLVLGEEVGEVAEAALQPGPRQALGGELVQVAAVAAAWAQSIG